MEQDLELFTARHYINVVAQPSPGQNRLYRASLGPINIWIRVGFSQVKDEFRFVKTVGPIKQQYFLRYVDFYRGSLGPDGPFYFVTEFCPNGSLLSAIVGNIVGQQSMQLIFRDIAYGIATLHQHNHHLVHRRLSLEAVLLTEDFVPRLSKFSAFRRVTPPKKLSFREHPIAHDPHYSPQELTTQAIYNDANFEYDPYPADIWHLGVMLFRATNGAFPFGDGHNLHELHKRQLSRDYHFQANLPVPLMELIRWMLEPDPVARPTIVQVVRHDWLQ